jgi:hypothetical protein
MKKHYKLQKQKKTSFLKVFKIYGGTEQIPNSGLASVMKKCRGRVSKGGHHGFFVSFFIPPPTLSLHGSYVS